MRSGRQKELLLPFLLTLMYHDSTRRPDAGSHSSSLIHGKITFFDMERKDNGKGSTSAATREEGGGDGGADSFASRDGKISHKLLLQVSYNYFGGIIIIIS